MNPIATDAALALARRDTVLRFALGVSFAFVMCEALNWLPSALAPILTGVLLANIPFRVPLKLGVVLVGAMAVESLFVCAVSVLLRDVPAALWVGVGILFFATFVSMLRGVNGVICMLMLICLAIIPVVAIASPANADLLPEKLIKAIFVAVLMNWAAHALFPRTLPPTPPPPKPPLSESVPIALAATCVVMPVMLLFLLYSPVQAMPVMIATVMLTSHFDVDHSRRDAYRRVAANMLGGSIGVCAYWVLLMGYSLVTLAILAFLVAFTIGALIVKGKTPSAVLVLANNGCFVIFSSSIAQGPATAGILIERLAYFSLAGLFVVGAMHLAWSWLDQAATRAQPA